MRKPRTVTRAAVAATTLLVLAACGGNPTSSNAAGSGDAESGPTDAEQLYEEIAGLSGQERRDRLVELAAEENGLNFYTSMNADIADAVASAFSDAFDIDVNTYRASSETVLQRILQEQDAGFAGNDVVETNAIELLALQTEGLMAPCISQELVDQVPDVGQFETWTATRFNLFAPAWNTNLITDPPKVWEDLADPKYDGKMALELGNYDWYMALTNYWLEQGKSQDEVDQLWADIVDGAVAVKGNSVMAELLGAGQFGLAGATYTYIPENAKADGAPVETQPYIDPVFSRPNGGSCMKTAQNPATAMLFMDWLLSAGGQETLASVGTTPSVPQSGNSPANLVPVDAQMLLDEGSEWSTKYDELLSGAEQVGN